MRAALQAYAAAFSRLDVTGVKQVYPGADEATLRRAFGALRSQQVEIQADQATITGETATVSSTLTASVVAQVGSQAPRRDSRRVTFSLVKRNGVWVITDRK